MADNFFKISKGVNLNPLTGTPSNPLNGDMYYDSSRSTNRFYINGNWTDVQSSSDVATAASLTSTNFTSSVVQSSLVFLTGSTAGSLHGLSAVSNAKQLIIHNKSTANITIKHQSTTEGTAANRIILPNSADFILTAGKSLQLGYDSAQSRWVLLNSSSSSEGGGGGSKNYLSAITTSQSTTPNTGNGDFELGSTAGWSLGTIGTLTNNLPTGTPTFGSGASGNLSITAVSSGQLSKSYSLSYASSAATTQGNMLASDAFYIDNSDQAKVLTWKFNYKAQTNPSNANWSGTSSNSFGVAVYDVTNSVWLGTSANFAMTQSSGIGTASGSFQTNSNTTQLRFVVYNANATSGAVTVYFDDFSVGPQIITQGTPVTDWVSVPNFSYTNVTIGSGGTQTLYYKRFGDSVFLKGRIALGTGGSLTGTLSMTLPFGWSIDSSKIGTPTSLIVGKSFLNSSSGSLTLGGQVQWTNTSNTILYFYNTKTLTGTNPVNISIRDAINGTSPFTWTVNDVIDFVIDFPIPITGWSSSVQMSSDANTRVVACRVHRNEVNQTGIAPNNSSAQLLFTTVEYDTHAAFNTSTGEYVAPVSGYYNVSACILILATNVLNNRYFINSAANGLTVVPAAGVQFGTNVAVTIYRRAGEVISFSLYGVGNNSVNTLTMHGNKNTSYATIELVSGPATIAASESVNARYTSVAGTSIPNTGYNNVPYPTKDYDSHGAYNTSTGIYTVPVSGKYRVSAVVGFGSSTYAANNAILPAIYKNGSIHSYGAHQLIPAPITSGLLAIVNGTVNCVAGDTIEIRVLNNRTAGATTLQVDAASNHLEIERIGN